MTDLSHKVIISILGFCWCNSLKVVTMTYQSVECVSKHWEPSTAAEHWEMWLMFTQEHIITFPGFKSSFFTLRASLWHRRIFYTCFHFRLDYLYLLLHPLYEWTRARRGSVYFKRSFSYLAPAAWQWYTRVNFGSLIPSWSTNKYQSRWKSIQQIWNR